MAGSRLLPAALLAALALPGCVERVLVVRSDPPGAKVSVNGVPLGSAPAAWSFLHYGTVRLEAEPLDVDGNGTFDTRPATLDHPLDPPWYQYPVIDFFVDVLWPWTVVDRQEALIRLPAAPDPDDPDAGLEELRRLERELRIRARDARKDAEAGKPPGEGGK